MSTKIRPPQGSWTRSGIGWMGRCGVLETPAPVGGAWTATSLGSGAPPGALGPLRGLPSLQLAAQAPPTGAGSQDRPSVGHFHLESPLYLFQVSDTPMRQPRSSRRTGRGVRHPADLWTPPGV